MFTLDAQMFCAAPVPASASVCPQGLPIGSEPPALQAQGRRPSFGCPSSRPCPPRLRAAIRDVSGPPQPPASSPSFPAAPSSASYPLKCSPSAPGTRSRRPVQAHVRHPGHRPEPRACSLPCAARQTPCACARAGGGRRARGSRLPGARRWPVPTWVAARGRSVVPSASSDVAAAPAPGGAAGGGILGSPCPARPFCSVWGGALSGRPRAEAEDEDADSQHPKEKRVAVAFCGKKSRAFRVQAAGGGQGTCTWDTGVTSGPPTQDPEFQPLRPRGSPVPGRAGPQEAGGPGGFPTGFPSLEPGVPGKEG